MAAGRGRVSSSEDGPHSGGHTPQSLRASIPELRSPFGLPFGREHFVVPELRSPTRSLSPNLGEQLQFPL
ncbi:MAG: hypothetical protein IJ632_04960 [Muribaculaceae bacterium]|nr:hypothetical protein [Muribaculaceae bacterium]